MADKDTSGNVFRLAAYMLFSLALLAFLGALLPALFLGEPTAALISGLVAIGSMMLALLAGWMGFVRGEDRPRTESAASPTPTTPRKEAHWRPEEMPMDEENWLRVHGGPGHKNNSPKDARRDQQH